MKHPDRPATDARPMPDVDAPRSPGKSALFLMLSSEPSWRPGEVGLRRVPTPCEMEALVASATGEVPR
jgi:hypothetical protein